jgi:hypothetical protein
MPEISILLLGRNQGPRELTLMRNSDSENGIASATAEVGFVGLLSLSGCRILPEQLTAGLSEAGKSV